MRVRELWGDRIRDHKVMFAVLTLWFSGVTVAVLCHSLLQSSTVSTSNLTAIGFSATLALVSGLRWHSASKFLNRHKRKVSRIR